MLDIVVTWLCNGTSPIRPKKLAVAARLPDEYPVWRDYLRIIAPGLADLAMNYGEVEIEGAVI